VDHASWRTLDGPSPSFLQGRMWWQECHFDPIRTLTDIQSRHGRDGDYGSSNILNTFKIGNHMKPIYLLVLLMFFINGCAIMRSITRIGAAKN